MSSTAHPHHSRRWLILGLIGVAQLMVVLDVTVVNVALPSAQRALGFSDDSRQWVVTAYALAFGSLLLLGGRVSDVLGRKWTFVAGLLGFAGASAVAGAAPSFGVLVAARAVQGVFGALLAPAALSLLTTTFTDPAERSKAFGVFGAIAGSGAAVGLLLGGVLTDLLSWRWSLYVNLLFALPTALGGLLLLHNQADQAARRIDLPGALTASAGLFGIVYGLANAETDAWGAPVTIVALAAGVALLGLFVALQSRVGNPLLPLRVVLDRNRGGSYLAIAIAGAGIFGLFLFITYYLQRNLGFSPLQTGLAFLPMAAAIMATAGATTTRILPRTGPRPLVPLGMALAAAAMVYLTRIDVASGYAGHVLPALVVVGVGFGLVIAPSVATATAGVRPADAGVASALVNTGQQVGGSLGTALLSTVANSAVASYAAGHVPAPGLMAHAAVHGYTTAFWWSAAIFVAGAIVCGALLRSGAPRPAPSPAAIAA